MRKISVKRHRCKGEIRWVVSRFLESGKRKRTIFPSKAAADAAVARIKQNGEAMSEKRPIISNKGQSLSDVITALLAAKKTAGRNAEYLKGLKLVLDSFARGRETLPIQLVKLADVESFLDSKRLAYRSTLRARLSTLFNFAVRREFIVANPCDRLEVVTYLKPSPQIFTPEQVSECLLWFKEQPRAMGWFVLTTFYGLRPEEAEKTAAKNINFKTGTVIVDGQTTKVRQRRVVERPHAKAHALLRLARRWGAEWPISRQVRRRTVRRLRKVLGWQHWPKDVTRHTAASYWLGLTRHADNVADQLGHSVKVLKRDYKALVTPEQVKAFWERKFLRCATP